MQETSTYLELGLPYMVEPEADDKKELSSLARSSNLDLLNDLGFEMIELNTIIVRGTDTAPVPDPSRPDMVVGASMFRERKVMQLNARFYTSLEHNSSLRDMYIEVGRKLRNFHSNNSIMIFLHELTHSQNVLDTTDHVFWYVESEIDVLNINSLARFRPTTNSTTTDTQPGQKFIAYGLEACLALIRRDERDSTNKAEDNADSWTIYFMMRMLILVYLEIDFLSASIRKIRFKPPIELSKAGRNYSTTALSLNDYEIKSQLYQPIKAALGTSQVTTPSKTTGRLLQEDVTHEK